MAFADNLYTLYVPFTITYEMTVNSIVYIYRKLNKETEKVQSTQKYNLQWTVGNLQELEPRQNM